jgi:hypothetical protein
MPFYVPDSINPPKDALVVCAGTVTCKFVSGMGAGFILFKKLFGDNLSFSNKEGGWQKELQEILDAFHGKKMPMPPYVRMAQQDGFIGGIATVAALSSAKGLGLESFKNDTERQIDFEEQYKFAIQQAIYDAQQLKRPLFIQPLGIGVYGWDPQIAAQLFAQAILSADPEDILNITIPIYDQKKGSNDIIFKEALISEMAKHGRKPDEKKESMLLKQEEKESFDNKSILLNILATLISNIENKNSGRWTSGVNSQKVDLLKKIMNSITSESEKISPDSPTQSDYLQQIMDVCLIKRNPIHFWATPTSVQEYKQLLQENGLELTTTRTSSSPHQ